MKKALLTTWKEIAGHLGVSVRNAQRLEKEEGLPVRRVGPRNQVEACSEELDRWKRERFDKARRSPGSRKVRFAVLLTLSVFVAGLVFLFLHRGFREQQLGNPAKVAIGENGQVEALDETGFPLWDKVFPEASSPALLASKIADLDNDGFNEVVLALRGTEADRVMCYEASGKLRWVFKPGRRLQWEDLVEPIPDAFGIRDFAIGSLSGGNRFVAVASACLLFFPSQAAILDQRGQLVGEYWNTGYIMALGTLDLDGDGTEEVLLGGVNNRYGRSPFLAAIDHSLRNAISPVPETYAPDLRAGKERAYVLFPRSDVAEGLHFDNRVLRIFTFRVPPQIAVEIYLSSEKDIVERAYTLDLQLRAKNLELSPGFLKLHRELWESGVLDHALDEIAEKETLRQIVRLVGGM